MDLSTDSLAGDGVRIDTQAGREPACEQHQTESKPDEDLPRATLLRVLLRRRGWNRKRIHHTRQLCCSRRRFLYTPLKKKNLAWRGTA